ncbi:BgTH12-07769 [Blumeria graminis f. sp. triticale]|uniref:Bgt-1906 n=3 Tax=Blumeria graminis TaxID=34373 RepID=A0A061HDT4_BLUGR|nr:hypothetical protein BGT96224_1906 [Blumeria graminis f. sp. tritici 96224]CAD6506542.1 BgTH12-07769 [Blumeria graminis f. sp. triticale]VDB96396.1 Bgt-1906 [Blumeria graminis f. sp. tritici]
MVSLYESSIPVFIKNLKVLAALLAKGSAHSGVTEKQLLESRLISDMGNLIYQIQRVSDTSKGLAVRAAKVEPVALEDKETTMEELQTRIERTITILESVKECNFVAEDAEVIYVAPTKELKFTGKSYVLEFAIPNFFFHFVTAYNLLRKEGVDIGKKDYLGMS